MTSDLLRKRAQLLRQLREFFYHKGFLEVETPIIANKVIPENHISPITIDSGQKFLQASPELHMKQLLCNHPMPIFQVARVFRADEVGRLHQQEFTMIEWYRPDDNMWQGIELLSDLVVTLLKKPAAKLTSYREAFLSSLAIDPHQVDLETLQQIALRKAKLDPAIVELIGNNRDEWLNALMNAVVEPSLGKKCPEILYHYPATQAALAEIIYDKEGNRVAERFELYVDGIELANGYHELVDPDELESRLVKANQDRKQNSLPELPLPIDLLRLMHSPGLPKSAGVALGFDRLTMLATGADSIADVISFPEMPS